MQTVRPGTILLDGDTASGRAYIVEFGRAGDWATVTGVAPGHLAVPLLPSP